MEDDAGHCHCLLIYVAAVTVGHWSLFIVARFSGGVE